jgi:hypothetical protein
LTSDNCEHCRRIAKAKQAKPSSRWPSKKRLAIITLILVIAIPLGVRALTPLGSQTLPKPNAIHATLSFSCATPSLVNVTDPNPLRTGFASGNNGTAVFGCLLSAGRISPAFQVVSSGTVNATLNLPANVTLSLIPNNSTLGPLSQAQCASQGIQLVNGRAISLALGSYSYCESFQDAGSLVAVTASWYQV